MDNRCFIIMPSVEPSGYTPGHFNRVYDYVIVPACRAAGYWPFRADQSTDSPMVMMRNIVDCATAVCDLSAGNNDALYALSIRSALDLPITPIKDLKSFVMFDTQEFSTVEYDESLRIDTVQKTIEALSEAIKKSVENKKDRHTLLTRLSIGLTTSTPPADSGATVFEVPEPAPPEPEPKAPLPIISPLPDYVGEPFTETQLEKMKVGDVLFHLVHGKGKVNSLKKTERDKLATIQFESGPKLLVLTPGNFFRKVNG